MDDEDAMAKNRMHPHSAVLGAKLPVSQVSNTEMSVYIKWSLLLQEQLSTASKQVAALRNFRAALAHDARHTSPPPLPPYVVYQIRSHDPFDQVSYLGT